MDVISKNVMNTYLHCRCHLLRYPSVLPIELLIVLCCMWGLYASSYAGKSMRIVLIGFMQAEF